jgi:hypothetical protein
MFKNSLKPIAGAVIAFLIMLPFLDGVSKQPNSAVAQSEDDTEDSTSSPSRNPRVLRFNLTISSPTDLKVAQGDRINAGAVISERVGERSRLSADKEALKLSLKQIESRTIPDPIAPTNIPTVKTLPPITYVEEDAAIKNAALNVKLAEEAFKAHQLNLSAAPLEESSAVNRAAVSVATAERQLINQERKLEAVAVLKDLPGEVLLHEQEVLKQRKDELAIARANWEQAKAKLDVATVSKGEKLQDLAVALEKARADLQIAIASLQSKKDQRAYDEYQASITGAQRAEERNRAQNAYLNQLATVQQQRREKDFQVMQIKSQISAVDEKLAALSTVTSPYDGTVRRIKFVRQNDNNLLVELTLAVNSTSDAGTGTRNFTSPTNRGDRRN